MAAKRLSTKFGPRPPGDGQNRFRDHIFFSHTLRGFYPTKVGFHCKTELIKNIKQTAVINILKTFIS